MQLVTRVVTSGHVTKTAVTPFDPPLLQAVASPGFVARRGKAGDYVMGHSRRASGPGAADCSITNSFVTNAVLVERAVNC